MTPAQVALNRSRLEKAYGTSKSAARYADWYDNYRDQQTFGEYLKEGPPEVDDTCSSCIGTGIGNPHDERSRCWECGGSGINKPRMEYES